jgi:hypothetical protein
MEETRPKPGPATLHRRRRSPGGGMPIPTPPAHTSLATWTRRAYMGGATAKSGPNGWPRREGMPAQARASRATTTREAAEGTSLSIHPRAKRTTEGVWATGGGQRRGAGGSGLHPPRENTGTTRATVGGGVAQHATAQALPQGGLARSFQVVTGPQTRGGTGVTRGTPPGGTGGGGQAGPGEAAEGEVRRTRGTVQTRRAPVWLVQAACQTGP